jgi:hypothetical protein
MHQDLNAISRRQRIPDSQILNNEKKRNVTFSLTAVITLRNKKLFKETVKKVPRKCFEEPLIDKKEKRDYSQRQPKVMLLGSSRLL